MTGPQEPLAGSVHDTAHTCTPCYSRHVKELMGFHDMCTRSGIFSKCDDVVWEEVLSQHSVQHEKTCL